MNFSFMQDPRWSSLDKGTKQEFIAASFDKRIATDPRWGSLDSNTQKEMFSAYLDSAEQEDQSIQAKYDAAHPHSTGENIRDIVSSITPAGYEDISTGFVKGATLGYVPAVPTPEDASMGHKVAAGAAHLTGMGLALVPAAAALPEVGVVAGSAILGRAATGAILGGTYGALRKPEQGETRFHNALTDAAMFAGFEGAGAAVTEAAGALFPKVVGAVLAKVKGQQALAKSALPQEEKLAELVKLQLTPSEQKIKTIIDYGKSAVLGMAGGALEPADTWDRRIENMAIGAGTFTGAHAVMAGITRPRTPRPGEVSASRLSPEEKDRLAKLEVGATLTSIIDTGMKDGKVGENAFSLSDASAMIKDGVSSGVFTESDIGKFKEKYPDVVRLIDKPKSQGDATKEISQAGSVDEALDRFNKAVTAPAEGETNAGPIRGNEEQVFPATSGVLGEGQQREINAGSNAEAALRRSPDTIGENLQFQPQEQPSGAEQLTAIEAQRQRELTAYPDRADGINKTYDGYLLNIKAHEAATSPTNELPEPTQGQKEAGNFKKGHVVIQGMDVAIENPAGSIRSGKDATGKLWSVSMQNHYGYFNRTAGKDGDQIDVFIGKHPDSPVAFVIDQIDPKTGKFDEHKTVIGERTLEDAKTAYLSNYEKGWKGLGAITEMPMDEFKAWVINGKRTKKPVAYGQKGAINEEIQAEAEAETQTLLNSKSAAPAATMDQPTTAQPPPELAGPFTHPDIVNVPINSISLSKDVPQFKADANSNGVVEGQELKGERYNRLPTNPVVLWERNNGNLEIITGRHRLDLARRLGEETIPSQVVKESDGFTAQDALTFDAEQNILDNQGRESDYAKYFRYSDITREEAQSRGILRGEKASGAFVLGKQATDPTFDAYRAGKLSFKQAVAISKVAPSDDTLQAAGRSFILKNPRANPLETENFVKALSQFKPEAQPAQGDLFGYDDTAIMAAETQAKQVAKIVGQLNNDAQTINSAIRKEGKLSLTPEAAQSYGITNPTDRMQLTAAREKALQEVSRWENWYMRPEMVERLKGEQSKDTIKGVEADAAPPVETSSNYKAEAERLGVTYRGATTNLDGTPRYHEFHVKIPGQIDVANLALAPGDNLEARLTEFKKKFGVEAPAPVEATTGDAIGKLPPVPIAEEDFYDRATSDSGPRNPLSNERGALSDLADSEIVAALHYLKDRTSEATLHLQELGQRLYVAGKETLETWTVKMKEQLGDLWGSFKGLITAVWDSVKSFNERMGERGAVGKDINYTPQTEPMVDKSGNYDIVKARRKGYVTNQLELDFSRYADNGKSTVDAVSTAGRKNVDPPRTAPVTIGSVMPKELLKKGYVSLVGKEVKSFKDLAAAAQIFRDPRVETLRFFYLKDGVIVGHEGYSSNMSGFVYIDISPKQTYHMNNRVSRLSADSVVVLHNHPSGDPTPSSSDITMTRALQERLSKMKGQPVAVSHVIINHKKYAVINADDQAFKIHKLPEGSTYGEGAATPHDLLGTVISGPSDLVDIGKSIQRKVGYGTLIFRGSKGTVNAIQDIPIGVLKAQGAMGYLRNRSSEFGAREAFLYLDDISDIGVSVAQKLITGGGLRDVVIGEKSIVEEGVEPQQGMLFGEKEEKYKATRVAEDAAGYTFTKASKLLDEARARIGNTTDASKKIRGVTDAIGLGYKQAKRAFYSPGLNENTAEVSKILIEQMGKNFHQAEKFKGQLNEVSEQYSQATSVFAKSLDLMKTSTGMAADYLFNKMPKEAQWSFISRHQRGEPQNTPELQSIDKVITNLFKDLHADEASVTPGGTGFRENYFVGAWEQASHKAVNQAIAEAMKQDFDPHSAEGKSWIKNRAGELYAQGKGKEGNEIAAYFRSNPYRSAEGQKAFLKEKVFDNIQDGIDIGLVPKGTPVDMAFARLAEGQKYVSIRRTLQQMAEDGKTAILIRAGEEPPGGYTIIPGPYGIMEKGPVAVGGSFTEGGGEKFKEGSFRYAVINDVAPVFNNYLSKSIYESPYAGQIWEAYMGAANTLNQFQLGVGSAFHAGFTSMEAVISHFALGVKALAKGDVAAAAKFIATSPAQIYKNPMIGDKLLRAYRGEAVQGEEIPQTVKWLEMAGARAHMDNRFRTTSTDKLIKDWAEGNKLSALSRSPFALVEQMARPIMEWLVPRQKFGVFAEMANEWHGQNPKATHEETRAAMQYIWNRVDSRLGQVVYERMLAHRVALNLVQGVVRAPGWSGGTIVEIGGGVNDFANVFRDISQGKKPVMTDKMAYTISLLTITGLINGVMTKLLTGEDPKDGMDLLAFRTGKIDERGNPERMLLPTYAKDIYAYINKPGQTLLNKTHPILSLMSDIAKNKDYYGVQIRDKEANMPQQVGQAGLYATKAFVPFWMRGQQKISERGGGVAEQVSPLIGIMPATAEFTKTPAQKLMGEILAERPKGMMTREKADRQELKRQYETRLRNNDPTAQAEMMAEVNKGNLTQRDIMMVRRALRTSPIVHSFGPLTLNEAIRVYDAGSEEEKKQFYPLLRRKIGQLHDMLPDEKRETLARVKEIMAERRINQ